MPRRCHHRERKGSGAVGVNRAKHLRGCERRSAQLLRHVADRLGVGQQGGDQYSGLIRRARRWRCYGSQKAGGRLPQQWLRYAPDPARQDRALATRRRDGPVLAVGQFSYSRCSVEQ